MESGFALLTADEQREHLRILEKMATKQHVVTPDKKTSGGMCNAAKRQRAVSSDDNAQYSELKDAFDKLDSGECERVVDPMSTPLPPDFSQMVNNAVG